MALSEITKTLVNAATLVVSVGTLVLHYTNGFLPANVAVVVSVVVSVAGMVVHYLAPNTTTNPVVADTQSVRLKSASPNYPKRAVS
jgi:hypothetical protein